MHQKIAKEEETIIIEGCIKGDRKYQKRLYELYSKRMFGVCLRYCDSKASAQDILQDGFVKVFAKLEHFKFQGSLEGWIRKVMVNTALEEFRKASNKFPLSSIDTMEERAFEDVNFGRLEHKDILNKIQELAPGYRAVFNMFVIEGYSHQEIAETLNITESTSKSQLSRARILLQNSIKK
jgi:RNA polymerase sigma factor (sigma-70 family)